jgi:hypothetical protein
MRDEELTDRQRLTPDHIAALENYPDGAQSAGAALRHDRGALRDTWGGSGERGTYPRRGEPLQYWWTHQPDAASQLLGADWWSDWDAGFDLLGPGLPTAAATSSEGTPTSTATSSATATSQLKRPRSQTGFTTRSAACAT